MGRARFAVVTGALALAAACGTLQGVSGTGGDAPDGGSDGGGGPDAIAGGDDAAAACGPLEGGFCAMKVATFCADFDNPACPLHGFSGASNAPGCDAASVVVDDEHHLGPGSALHGRQGPPPVPNPGLSAHCGPTVSFKIPSTTTGSTIIQIDLQLRVEARPSGTAVGPDHPQRLGPVHLAASGGATIDFYIESDKSYFILDESLENAGGSTYSNDSNGATTTMAWHPVTFLVVIPRDGGTSTFKGLLDNVVITSPPDQLMPKSIAVGETLTLTVGYDASELAQGEIFVDDVVVDVGQ